MNKAIIAIVAAILVGAGLWFALSGGDSDTGTDQQPQETTQPQDQESAPAEESQTEENTAEDEEAEGVVVQVSYTDSGFEPESITVNAGDTVTWTNESSSAMWVASDDHPVHNDYPGFDQQGNGQTYSFTFEQTGTWGYHNHSNSSQGGTITVN